MGYVFSGDFHAKKEGFDFAQHTVYGQWRRDGFYILPRYTYAQFGGSYVFQSIGSDIVWEYNGWKAVYAVDWRKYTDNLNGSDLRRLAGWINRIHAYKSWHTSNLQGLVGVGVKDEAARGNSTVARSDAYRQASLSTQLVWKKNRWQVSGFADVYARKYREKNPISSNPRRRDTHTQLSTKIAWHPESSQNWSVALNSGWQQNISNDREKSYVEWRSGVTLQAEW